MWVSSANSTVCRALRVVCSNDALPWTVVMPRRSNVRAPSRIAITSSWPGSQSIMIVGCICSSRSSYVIDYVRRYFIFLLCAVFRALRGKLHTDNGEVPLISGACARQALAVHLQQPLAIDIHTHIHIWVTLTLAAPIGYRLSLVERAMVLDIDEDFLGCE